jgi:DNA-binding CsgD family transcriptional regulator
MATNVVELRRMELRAPTLRQFEDVGIRDRSDIRAAATKLRSAARSQAVRIMVWHDLATLTLPVDADDRSLNAEVFGWTKEELVPWMQTDKALCSPLTRAARFAHEPFWIDRSGIRVRSSRSYLRTIDFTCHEDTTLIDGAYVIPVHMAFGQIGMAVIVGQPAGEWNVALEQSAHALAPAVARFIADYVATTIEHRFLPSDATLSSREIECLTWIAHGKTDYEIGVILGCSHAGVRYHVSRICTKLGTVNRTQSVFRACQLGYLGVPIKA